MKVEVEHHKYDTIHYICERCGHKWQNSGIYISNCPVHGDFCLCCSKKPYFPFAICPDCNITDNEICAYQYQNNNPPDGPMYMIKNLLLPEPFIILKHDPTGFWIGSKETDNENIS